MITPLCIFNKAFSKDGPTDKFLIEAAEKNTNKVQSFATTVLYGEFMGCRDCNEKLTISNYLKDIFAVLFNQPPPPKKPKPKTGSDADDAQNEDQGSVGIMVHYIMLSVMLMDRDRFISTDSLDGDRFISTDSPEINNYLIQDDVRKKTWTLRCIVMWCALQILHCNWKLSTNFEYARHHVDYV